jgi:hypothetical protein
MNSQRFLNAANLNPRFFGYGGTGLVIAVLISVIIYLAVQKAKTPPPASTIMVEKECPACPRCETCLTYELISDRKSTKSLVSPGVMYYLNVGEDCITFSGFSEIWKIQIPGASTMSVNKKGQFIVSNGSNVVVYETPAQPEGPQYIAYISNQGKLEVMNMNTRIVVFSK